MFHLYQFPHLLHFKFDSAILRNRSVLPERTLHFCLFNNFGIVDRGWRLVTAYGQPWQLYHLRTDRTEMHDLADENPRRLAEMLKIQADYVARDDVTLRVSEGEAEPTYAPVYRADGRIGPPGKENPLNPTLARLASLERSKGKQLGDVELEAIKQRAATLDARKPNEGAPTKSSRKKRKGGPEEGAHADPRPAPSPSAGSYR